jgi:hypothetical protein
MNNIKKQIEDTIYWVRVDQKKMVLLIKGKSKKDTKRKIKKIIIENDFIKNATIYRLIIKFHNEKKMYNNGVMSFNIFNYKVVDKKLIKTNYYGKVGRIWFEKEWLNYNGWEKKYISNVMNLLRKDKAKIIIPGINYYHLLGLH